MKVVLEYVLFQYNFIPCCTTQSYMELDMKHNEALTIRTLMESANLAENLNKGDVVEAIRQKVKNLLGNITEVRMAEDKDFLAGETGGPVKQAELDPQEQFIHFLGDRCPCCILQDYVVSAAWDNAYTLQDFLYHYARIEGFETFRGLMIHLLEAQRANMESMTKDQVIESTKRMSELSKAGVEAQRQLASEGRAPALHPMVDLIQAVIGQKVADL